MTTMRMMHGVMSRELSSRSRGMMRRYRNSRSLPTGQHIMRNHRLDHYLIIMSNSILRGSIATEIRIIQEQVPRVMRTSHKVTITGRTLANTRFPRRPQWPRASHLRLIKQDLSEIKMKPESTLPACLGRPLTIWTLEE